MSMAGLNRAERATVSALRSAFHVCRFCKVKLRSSEPEGCPHCGNRMQRPTEAYHEAYPTVERGAHVLGREGERRFPSASTRGRCIYCAVVGDDMQGEGLRKCCRDEIACAGRVRAANPSGHKAVALPPAEQQASTRRVAGATSTTPAQTLIEIMQREAGIAELDGPLDYGESLRLPIEAVQARQVLFGKGGCGKTHGGAVILESNAAAGVPVCGMDTIGNLWGIRCAGKGGPGLPIPIIGGEHGDLSLEWTDGPRLAAIFASGVPMLIDLSMLALEEQQKFGADFFRELLRTLRRPAHVLVEEAETFCPAFARSGPQFAVQGATTLFARQIRNYGVGWTFSTQRQRLLHSDAVDNSSAFFAMQSTGEKTQRAILAEARTRLGKTVADAIMSEVGTLSRGEAWLMPDPSWLGGERSAPVRFRFRDRRTFDSSYVPKVGETPPVAPPMVEVDLRPFAAVTEKRGASSQTRAKRRR